MVATLHLSRSTVRMDAVPHADAVAAAVRVLRAEGLAALPTETVYGLAADASAPEAVAALYAAKGRPASNPLIVHVATLDQAARIAADWTSAADALAAAFWPGPLTLVLPVRRHAVAQNALAGGTTVALRMPASRLMRDVAGDLGPLVAPSANRSGKVSATSADAVVAELGGAIDLVIDGGPSPIGVESTVVDVAAVPQLLRPGAVSVGAMEAVLGRTLTAGDRKGPLRSPGLLASHYAPRARVRLDVAAGDVAAHEGFLMLGGGASPVPAERTVRLSPSGDLNEAARNLYAGLRALDATGVRAIAVSPIPADGIGLAIRDRLIRAAAPRPSEDHP